MMKNSLEVIECDYCYNAWNVQCRNGKEIYSSRIKPYTGKRCIDIFHDHNSYASAGVPFEVTKMNEGNRTYQEPCLDITHTLSVTVQNAVRQNKAIVIPGGYCNYAPAVVGGIQQAMPGAEIGIVWIDAHSDNHIAEQANGPVRLVAVPLSTMAGQTLPWFRKEICGLRTPVKGQNIIASDIRIMSEETATNMEKAGIHHLDASEFRNPESWQNAIQQLSARVDVIYLSVDMDILIAEYIPSYEKRVPYGQDLETVKRNIQIVMNTGKVAAFSVFCADFDHFDQGGPITANSAEQLLTAGLKAWK